MDLMITWLVRFAHVLGGGFWLGGYVVLALLNAPRLADGGLALNRLAQYLARAMTITGTATIAIGALLIARTRGYDTLLDGGEWGVILGACIVIAVALLGLGDSALMPALRRL